MSPPQSPRPYRQLLELAWPIVVSRSAQMIIGFSDAVMVASLGESELAAATAGGLNSFSFFILPMGIVFVVSTFASQLFGKGDMAGARRYAWYGLLVSAAAGVLCLAVTPFTYQGLAIFDYTPEVHTLMAGYLSARLLSGGAAVGMEALSNYYGGVGNTRLPMLAGVLAMVLNVFLNWVFIFGHLGVPALGVTGAAYASSLSTWLAFSALLAAFLKGYGVPGGNVVVRSSLQLQELKRLLVIGIPSGLNWFFEFAAFTFFINVVVTGLGTTALAAMMAVFQLNSVSFMPAFGVASAGAILVGQSIGAGQKDAVPSWVLRALVVTASWQLVVGIIYLTAPRVFLDIFSSGLAEQEEFLRVAGQLLILSVSWQLFDAAVGCLAESLRAAGDTAFCLWARLVIAWAVFVPGSVLTARVFHGGHVAVVMWLAVYLGLLALVLGLRFRHGAWRHIQLTSS